MAPLFSLVFFALFQPALSSLYTPDQMNQYKKICAPFFCGNLGGGEIQIPYRKGKSPDYCGPFVMDGCDEREQRMKLEKEGKLYAVESISLGNTIAIRDDELQKNLKSNSCESFNNLTLPNHLYSTFHIRSSNLTMLKCEKHTTSFSSQLELLNYTGCPDFNIYYPSHNQTLPTTTPLNCSILQLPANGSKDYDDIFELLNANFSLEVEFSSTCYWCPFTGGKCSRNNDGQLECIRPNKGGRNLRLELEVGLAVSLPGVGILFITVYFFMRKLSSSSFLHRRKADNNRNIDAFLKKHGSSAPTIYTYSQVKKMTNSFNDKLGQGGFGTVFKGKLPDGREVAVKVLKESKKDGEEFINEVASISQTSHVNVVSLLGFCIEGSKRALLYEYMVNGSLEKYIFQENPIGADRQLGWGALYQIALGIARGLEYLHRGCNTRILHFDIKPHNILLDENFSPKISDFGLARVCPEKESILSKVTARGTPGYTAPEFFLRNLGGISHKSDVYSYGLMVLEMVGGRKNLCVGVDKISEIYFPGWVHKRLLLDEELGLPGISHEEENQIARKLITVSLWCIQTSPSDRPSMGKVVEMLQGTLDSLPIPPRPYLSSPSRSPDRSVANSSTTSATTIEL